MENLKQYINANENIKLSKEVSYLGNKYREGVIRKKVTGAFSDKESYIYIDENDNVINDKDIINHVAELTYYYDIFYGDPKSSLRAVCKSEEEEDRDRRKYEGISEALDFLNGEGDKESSSVKEIMMKFPGIRRNNNALIKDIIDKIKELEDRGEIFSEKDLEILYPAYMNAMGANFESIKYIERGRSYYSDLKSMTDKKRRKFAIRWNRKLSNPLFDLSNELGYYVKLLITYDKVLYMNPNKYIKFLEKSLKDNIQYKINKIRSI